MDSLALAWFATRTCRQLGLEPRHVADLGAGSGLVAILIGRAEPQAHTTLYELQPQLAERATRNLRANGLLERARVVVGDLAQHAPQVRYDLVVCNPPFHRPGRQPPPANAEKRLAHFESTAPLELLGERALQALLPGGLACLVYPWDAVKRLETWCNLTGWQWSVTPLCHRPADPVPVRALAALRQGPLPVAEPLALHQPGLPDSTFSAELTEFVQLLAAKP